MEEWPLTWMCCSKISSRKVMLRRSWLGFAALLRTIPRPSAGAARLCPPSHTATNRATPPALRLGREFGLCLDHAFITPGQLAEPMDPILLPEFVEVQQLRRRDVACYPASSSFSSAKPFRETFSRYLGGGGPGARRLRRSIGWNTHAIARPEGDPF